MYVWVGAAVACAVAAIDLCLMLSAALSAAPRPEGPRQRFISSARDGRRLEGDDGVSSPTAADGPAGGGIFAGSLALRQQSSGHLSLLLRRQASETEGSAAHHRLRAGGSFLREEEARGGAAAAASEAK